MLREALLLELVVCLPILRFARLYGLTPHDGIATCADTRHSPLSVFDSSAHCLSKLLYDPTEGLMHASKHCARRIIFRLRTEFQVSD